MAEQHVRTYEKKVDFQLDHLMMQRQGFQMVFISSNVKISEGFGAGLNARLASIWDALRPATLFRWLNGNNHHHCRIIAVYERNR